MPSVQPAAPLALIDWTFSPDARVEEAIAHIFRTHPPLYPNGLERMRHFLGKLGNPHLKLPFVFHVAGTNGKGSTLAFLQAIFEAGGLKVHKYTSPHLVSFDERITLQGAPISYALLLELIDECEKAAKGEEVSFFEFFTALAFLAFSRQPADVVLLETGMGGLYDATNVVEKNLISLLTTISYDHTHILGPSLGEIAAHKAGIIKPPAPCVIAPQEKEALDVFAARGAPLYTYDCAWTDKGFTFKSAEHTFHLPAPSLQGRHQIYNAGLAIAALERSPFAALAEQKMLERAMQRVDWPGRLQRIKSKLLPEGWELWLDGAHNDSGAEALAAQAQQWGHEKPLHLITAMKRTKDVSGFYRPLLPHAASIQAVDSSWIEAPMLTAEDLCRQIMDLGYESVKTAATLESTLRALAFQFDQPQRILVTGSLYLVGQALKKPL